MSDTAPDRPRRKRVKWEPWALMALLFGLGIWLVWSPISGLKDPAPSAGARKVELRVGNARGIVEIVPGVPPAEPRFRVMLRNGFRSESLSAKEFQETFGAAAYEGVVKQPENPLFRVMNITSWGALAWVCIGLGGQIAFTGRTLIQWLVSERRRESVVPELFWWLSLVGGLMLFTYFVWRQDFVGVLGQSMGAVIYARNLRLIYKQRRRAAAATGEATATSGV